ncbi:putative transcription factor bHLH041 [Lolium rigidum]|uniref:putative transcription factor bHLH041 n=1 Tax=Lolium rigidum TaxID=89674 RepID=UPI001F5D85BF|nr:putative transcription factor bHLH041 [Lolium rigidum]
MDTIFSLAAVPRARVLERAAAHVPGCLYLCLWAPVTAQPSSSHLFCLDAWIGGGGGDRARATFEAYRGALCAVVSGCVPGWAYKDGRAYLELPEPALMASASLQVQQRFYHEAGTKMAVFMGCESGEIEVGMSTTSVPAATVADHVQQALLEEILELPPARPSSSSSSMPSLSIGSPEYSSLIRSMATSVAAAGEPSAQSLMLASPLPGLLAPVYDRHGFPTAEPYDAAAMAEAMLALISSSDASTTSTPPPPPSYSAPSWLARHHTSPRRTTAFKAYSAARAPRARPRQGAPGQRMIKTCVSLLASVHMAMRSRELGVATHEDGRAQPPPASASSQLHHMISERRRRERINDSFQSLRALLPPGCKKDKANVLASTTEYMAKLISQVSQLQDQNRQLEAQLGLNPTVIDDGSSQKIEVEVTTGASTSTSSASSQAREVSVRLTVRADCDISEVLISLLARLKETGSFAVVSVDARQQSGALARASLTLRVMEAGYVVDETWLKEALTKVVEDATTATAALPGSP